jgi:ParB family transcriptional regulator, chromosome partitioning protein
MALGKSLGNILGDYFGEETKVNLSHQIIVQQIPISKITVTEFQTRKFFDPKAITILANSILENGLIHPVLLVQDEDQYTLISGERRLRAVTSLGQDTIMAIVKQKDSLSDPQKAMLTAVENMHREGLSPLEQAKTYELIMLTKKVDEREIAETFNLSAQYIRNYLRLLTTSGMVQEALAQKRVTEGQIRYLTGLSHADQNIILKQIIAGELTVKEVQKLVQNYKSPKTPNLKQRVGHKIPPLQILQIESLAKTWPNSKIKISGDKDSGKVVISW